MSGQVKIAKREFRAALTTVFRDLDERQVDKFWAQLRAEVTVEEIQDAVRPLHRLGVSLSQRREARSHLPGRRGDGRL